jgi:hypothetical protein
MPDQPSVDPFPVERFRPSSGYWLGWVGVACFGLLAAESLARSRSLAAVALAAALLWGAVAMWIGLVRPRVEAHADHLLLRNAFRDAAVPWHLVDGIVVRLTLKVYVGDHVHHASSISRTARSIVRGGTPRGRSGLMSQLVPAAADVDLPAVVADYPGYVETRLRDLASQRSSASTGRERVTTAWATAPVTAFAVLGLVAAVLALAVALT